MNTPLPNLRFILDTLEIIRDNTPDNKEAFMCDLNAKDASLMRLQDIGEQRTRIRDKFPDYYNEHGTNDWHKIVGLRNLISHGYREVDFEIIWDIIENHLTSFSRDIASLVP